MLLKVARERQVTTAASLSGTDSGWKRPACFFAARYRSLYRYLQNSSSESSPPERSTSTLFFFLDYDEEDKPWWFGVKFQESELEEKIGLTMLVI